MKKEWSYQFSVVLPLTEQNEHLEEAMESLIRQTIGFEEHIQVILAVNGNGKEANEDNHANAIEEVCRRYQERYPQNVICVDTENAGLAAARNEGMHHIGGQYVNFFNGDDKWAPDAFAKAAAFLDAHPEIDAVCCRSSSFGSQEGFDHPLDENFRKERVVDIRKEPACVQPELEPVWIRSEALEGREFDVRLESGSGFLFLNRLLLEKGTCGILPEAVYERRRSLSGLLLTDPNCAMVRSWYTDILQHGLSSLMVFSKKTWGKVIPYVQNLVMYEIQWRLKKKTILQTMTELEVQEYGKRLKQLLQEIEDSIIWKQKYISYPYKCYAFQLKYGENPFLTGEVKDGKLVYRGISVLNLKAKERVRIHILNVENDRLVIDGETPLAQLGERCQMFAGDQEGGVWPVKLYPAAYTDERIFNGDLVYRFSSFHLELPLKYHRKFTFWAQIGDEKINLKVTFKRHGKLNEQMPHTYYACGGYLIKYRDGVLNCIQDMPKTHLMAELRYMKDLLREKKRKLILYRLAYFWKKKWKKKPLWLLCDRSFRAGDNGEALFRYLQEHADGEEDVRFFLYKDSADYSRLKGIGKVIPYHTFRYNVNFLLADKVISSHIDGWTTNAFGEDVDYMKNLYQFDYVFLQHGIIQNDLSGWLQKHKKNIRLFVTSARPEWESIVNGDYGYTEEEVKLLGLPRYDRLQSEPQKIIAFLPTWRQNIAMGEGRPGIREYSAHFKETEYFRFYNSLMNDERLLDAMKAAGYTGEFYIHPALSAQAVDFEGNEVIAVGKETTQYNEIFRKASLMVTDYSSVAFDFAYLKKPIVYSQFDVDVFYHQHINKEGYFSYERDAFGPVCYDYEAAVNAILAQIESGCVMEEQYRQRVDQFFAYTDRKNCERVYQAIKQL